MVLNFSCLIDALLLSHSVSVTCTFCSNKFTLEQLMSLFPLPFFSIWLIQTFRLHLESLNQLVFFHFTAFFFVTFPFFTVIPSCLLIQSVSIKGVFCSDRATTCLQQHLLVPFSHVQFLSIDSITEHN